MNFIQPRLRQSARSKGGLINYRVCITGAIVLLITGCAGLSKPNIGRPDFNIPVNSESFKNRFYAGAGMGSVTLKPDTSDTRFTADSASAGASHIRFGYDVHNMLAVEVDSALLGEADINEGVGTSVKYSSFSASALIYGLSGVENRSRREKWSGFGKLGYSVNRKASNIQPLNRSDAEPVIGLGVEYGFANGIGVRGEVTRYGSESTFVGIGAVYRFNTLNRFIPAHLAQKEDQQPHVVSDSNYIPAGKSKVTRVHSANDQTQYRQASVSEPGVKVRVLASATDYDTDGIENDTDKCPDTLRGTEVATDGCGIFDGTLANSIFTTGSAKLEESTKASLDNLAVKLKAFPEVRLAIEGHTDGKGPEDINMNVSNSRASMVRNYLISKGVEPHQLDVRAYGETRPIASNDTEQGRDINRRIEFVTLSSLTPEEIASEHMLAEASKSSSTAKRRAGVTASEEPLMAAAMPGIDLLPAGAVIPGLKIGGLLNGVEFQRGSATLTNTSVLQLNQLAAQLNRFPSVRVAVMAHENSKPTAQENLKLSQLQAREVVKTLVQNGVTRNRMSIEGYGDTLPVVQALTNSDHEINRRIELRVLPEG